MQKHVPQTLQKPYRMTPDMHRRSFSDLLWSCLLKTWGGVINIVGVVLAIIGFFVVPNTSTLALKWVLVVFVLFCLLLTMMSRAAWEAYNSQTLFSPKVLIVMSAPKAYKPAFALFLVEPAPLFSHDTVVSIYYLQEDVEKLVAIGKVINIQYDQKIQIIVQDYDIGDKAQGIENNSVHELSRLIVKPSLPNVLLEAIDRV